MDIKTINCLINNSTWINHENNTIYEFVNDTSLSINGKEHFQYSINVIDNKLVIQIGARVNYCVDYINDFILCFYNNNEKFRITPE